MTPRHSRFAIMIPLRHELSSRIQRSRSRAKRTRQTHTAITREAPHNLSRIVYWQGYDSPCWNSSLHQTKFSIGSLTSVIEHALFYLFKQEHPQLVLVIFW